MNSHKYIGSLLVERGIVDAEGLARALAALSTTPASLGRTLANLNLAAEDDVAQATAAALRLEFFSQDPPQLAGDLAQLLPAEFCRKRGALVIGAQGNSIRVAVTDPADYSLVQDVEFRTGKRVIAVVVTQSWLERALEARAQGGAANAAVSIATLEGLEPAGEVESAPEPEYEVLDPASLIKDTKLPPVVRLVNLILSEAAEAGASDVHIEPWESSLQVRQRVDGLLREVRTIPHRLQDQTVSRLKIISGMDISERRKPQDGRSRLRYRGHRIDLRVSTLPTQFGEKVVIRLLRTDTAILRVDQLGFAADNLRAIQGFLSRPQGMVLVTGPTGSGKTSTLYAALSTIKSPTNNIITLEDPIEFQVPGVNQTQINVRAGVTFASGLRSILRQDPNIILVGEIRDTETAEVALQAAQTGHLLLSTLHTNDAAATITRLFDLGIPPFIIASSLLGIVAQRLVRRPCASCAVRREPEPEVLERLGHVRLPESGAWVRGSGCDSCGGTGYKGRLAIHEVLAVNEEIRALIANRAAEQTIRAAAQRSGMRLLMADGLQKAAAGLTTLDEVLRVAPMPDATSERAPQSPASAAPAPTDVVVPASIDSQASTATSDRPRVLIVEDSPTIRSVVRYFLELEGFEVLMAEDGLRGLEEAQRERPSLIVSDVNMPGMDGVALVRAIRKDPRTRNVRMLMLTSETGLDLEEQAFQAGADDFLAKPVEPRRLAARIKALLGRRTDAIPQPFPPNPQELIPQEAD